MTLDARQHTYLVAFGHGAGGITSPDLNDFDNPDYFAGWRDGYRAREVAGLAFAKKIQNKEYINLFRMNFRKERKS